MRELRQSGASFPNDNTHATLREQALQVKRQIVSSPGFAAFIKNQTNYLSHFDIESSFDSSLFIHSPMPFNHCYNALCHRVLRATGEEYPDFLLCNRPELALGNVLYGKATEEKLRVSLMTFFYFNRLGPNCNPEECRQGWVSNTVETKCSDHGFMETNLRPIDLFF